MDQPIETMKLQGKDYAKVCDRLSYFHKHHKDGVITTDVVMENGCLIVKATIKIGGKTKATGTALKTIKAEFNLEKAETRAIGRALGIMGIMSDGSISTYEEVAEATKGANNGK